MPIQWLHPALLSALLLASLPLLVHFFGRKKNAAIPLPTLRFLEEIDRRTRRMEQIRQWLLLLLRMLLIIAIVLAVARPQEESRDALVGRSAQRHLFVLDASASMEYQVQGDSLFDIAKNRIDQELRALPPGDSANILVVGDGNQLLASSMSTDISGLRNALKSAGRSQQSRDVASATEDIASASNDAMTVWVASDFSTPAWRRDPVLEANIELRRLNLSPNALGNIAIQNIQVKRSTLTANERVVEVELFQSGQSAPRTRTLKLFSGDDVVSERTLPSNAAALNRLSLTYRFPTAGLYPMRVELSPKDPYPKDDTYFFGVEVDAALEILVVNGDPSATPYEDEVFFLERALASVPEGQSVIRVNQSRPEELNSLIDNLEGFDVIFLANVPALADIFVDALAEFNKKGGGIIISLGDKVDFERYNQTMAPILVRPLRDKHRALDRDSGSNAVSATLATLSLQSQAQEPLEKYLQTTKTAMYFNVKAQSQAGESLIKFEQGVPMALYDKATKERGPRMLITTSIDRQWSDWVLRPGYVSLAQRLVRLAAASTEQNRALKLVSHQDFAVESKYQGMMVTGPKTEHTLGPRFRSSIDGQYLVNKGDSDTIEGIFSSNTSREESDFSLSGGTESKQSASENTNFAAWLTTSNEQNSGRRGFAYLALLFAALTFVLESSIAIRG